MESILRDSELENKIIQILKDNNGEMESEILCDLLGITSFDIPWGYKIGWSKCLQANQKYHLIINNKFG